MSKNNFDKMKAHIKEVGRAASALKKIKPKGYVKSGDDYYPFYSAKDMVSMYKAGMKYAVSPEAHLLNAIFGDEAGIDD